MKREKQYRIRFTETEFDDLKRLAQDQNVTMSFLIREAIERYKECLEKK